MSNFKSILKTVALLLTGVAGVQAATRTWDGQASDGDFATPANWDGNASAPSSGDILQVGPNQGTLPILAFNSPGGTFNAPSFTFLATLTSGYTVTAASFSDVLNLTGTGTTLQNLSSARQRFDLITVSLATSQTWNGGSRGLQIAQVDLGTSHTLIIDGTGTTATTRNEALGGFTGGGISGIVKQGTGTLLMNTSVASDYTGPTTISGGIMLLGANNQIPDSSKLTLDGGMLQAAGFDDTMGAISLTKNSTIDFGLGANLAFAASAAESWGNFTLTISNFDLGQDTWRVGTNSSGLTASQLSHILFNGTTPAKIDALGFVTPVPEPTTGVLLLFVGAVSLAHYRVRRGVGGEAR